MAESRPPQTVSTLPVADLRDVEVVAVGESQQPVLRGSRCRGCGVLAFPARARCTSCQQTVQQDVDLPDEGSLYAFTTVHVSAQRPTPYTLGFVDLPGDLRILGEVLGPLDEIRVGDPVVVAVGGDGAWGFRRKA